MKARWSCQDGCKFDLCQSCYIQREGYPQWTCPSCTKAQLLPGQKAKARVCKHCGATAASIGTPSSQAVPPSSDIPARAVAQPETNPPATSSAGSNPPAITRSAATPAVSNCPPLLPKAKPVPALHPAPAPATASHDKSRSDATPESPASPSTTVQSLPTPRLPGGITTPRSNPAPDAGEGEDVTAKSSTKSWRRSRKAKKSRSEEKTEQRDVGQSSHDAKASASLPIPTTASPDAASSTTDADAAALPDSGKATTAPAAPAAAGSKAIQQESPVSVAQHEDAAECGPVEIVADENVKALGFSMSTKRPSTIIRVVTPSWAHENGVRAGFRILSLNGVAMNEDSTNSKSLSRLFATRPLTLVLLPTVGPARSSLASGGGGMDVSSSLAANQKPSEQQKNDDCLPTADREARGSMTEAEIPNPKLPLLGSNSMRSDVSSPTKQQPTKELEGDDDAPQPGEPHPETNASFYSAQDQHEASHSPAISETE